MACLSLTQPVGGRPGGEVAPPRNNPFEPRFFVASSRPSQRSQSQRMVGQHGPAMRTINEFAGAAGVSSSMAARANVHQEPRDNVLRTADHSNAAGAATQTVSQDMFMFHDGPQGRRGDAHEGTVRSKVVTGAAAVVEEVSS